MRFKTPILILSIAAIALALVISPFFFFTYVYSMSTDSLELRFDRSLIADGIMNVFFVLAPAVLAFVCAIVLKNRSLLKVFMTVVYVILIISSFVSIYKGLDSIGQAIKYDAGELSLQHFTGIFFGIIVSASFAMAMASVLTEAKSKILLIIAFSICSFVSIYNFIGYSLSFNSFYSNGTYIIFLRSVLAVAKNLLLYAALFLISLSVDRKRENV